MDNSKSDLYKLSLAPCNYYCHQHYVRTLSLDMCAIIDDCDLFSVPCIRFIVFSLSIRFDSTQIHFWLTTYTHGSASNNKIIIIYIAIALLFYSVLYRSDQTMAAAATATSGCSFRTKRERMKKKRKNRKDTTARNSSDSSERKNRLEDNGTKPNNRNRTNVWNVRGLYLRPAGCMNVVHLCMHKNLIRSPLNCTKSREKCTPNGVIAEKVRKMWCNRETRAKKAKTKTHTIEIILNYIRTWAHATKIKRHYCQWPEWLVGSVGSLVGAATATVVAVSAARTRERYTVIHFNCAKIYLPVVD